MTNHPYSTVTIREYLLGRLPPSETERLDELSITDDDCVEIIRSVEHELVDAFARGDLRGSDLEEFRSRYLSNDRGRRAARFAEALQSLGEKLAAVRPSEGPRMLVRTREKTPWNRLVLAAAVVVLATASAWLAFDNRMLRARVTDAESSRDRLDRDRQLREAEARRSADSAPPSTVPAPSPLVVATLILSPELRGARRHPTLALAGAGDLAVQLDLEPVDYPSYTASLVASNGRSLWQADRLIARSVGSRKVLDLRLPAAAQSPQDYLIRVSGVPARGAPDIVGEYRFTVVR
jgi:hypothetical protein